MESGEPLQEEVQRHWLVEAFKPVWVIGLLSVQVLVLFLLYYEMRHWLVLINGTLPLNASVAFYFGVTMFAIVPLVVTRLAASWIESRDMSSELIQRLTVVMLTVAGIALSVITDIAIAPNILVLAKAT